MARGSPRSRDSCFSSSQCTRADAAACNCCRNVHELSAQYGIKFG
jgi:hypothetical protein